jgi:hypothetical protein
MGEGSPQPLCRPKVKGNQRGVEAATGGGTENGCFSFFEAELGPGSSAPTAWLTFAEIFTLSSLSFQNRWGDTASGGHSVGCLAGASETLLLISKGDWQSTKGSCTSSAAGSDQGAGRRNFLR